MADKLKADVLSAFNGGEITPELSGRVDKEELKFGTRYVSNFLPTPQGGLKKWYGTTKIGTVPVNVSNGYRLIPFDGASEPISLLFVAGNVYAVSNSEIWQQDFQMPLNQILNASYLQINDLMYFANEDVPVFQIQYFGLVDGHHTFNIMDNPIKEEPFFPYSWRGNYNKNIQTDGYTGTITMQAIDTVSEYTLQLPVRLQAAGAGVNLLFENTITDAITAGDSDTPSTVTTGTSKLQLVRIRGGIEEVVYEAEIGNDVQLQEV